MVSLMISKIVGQYSYDDLTIMPNSTALGVDAEEIPSYEAIQVVTAVISNLSSTI